MFDGFATRNQLISLLGFFSCCFYYPSWEYFCCFLLGMLSVTGQKQVTQIYLASDSNKHWTNFHRFLRQYKWSAVEVSNRFVLLIMSHLQPHLSDSLTKPVRLFGIFDDLKIKKSGKSFESLGNYRDYNFHGQPNRTEHIHGHNWVVWGLLVKTKLLHKLAFLGFWLWFPLKIQLYTPKSTLKPGQEFRTKTQIVASMIKELQLPQGVVVTHIGDGGYNRRIIFDGIREAKDSVIVKIRKDANIFSLPKPEEQKPLGRKRKKGAKLSLKNLATEVSFTTYSCFMYSKQRDVQIYEQLAYYPLAKQNVRLVICHWDNRSSIFLVCTDLKLSCDEIVEAYGGRWNIETGNQESKQHGLSDYQVRKDQGMERFANFVIWSQSLVQLLPLIETDKVQEALKNFRQRIAPWRQDESITRGQIRWMLQSLLARDVFLRVLHRLVETGKKVFTLRQIKEAIFQIC
jgi:hypothetical protein